MKDKASFIISITWITLLVVTISVGGAIRTSEQYRSDNLLRDIAEPPYGSLRQRNDRNTFSNRLFPVTVPRKLSGKGYFIDKLMDENRRLVLLNRRASSRISRYKNIIAKLRRENKSLRHKALLLQYEKAKTGE